MGFQKKQTEELEIDEPTVPTTFNMRISLKNKAKIYATMYNAELDKKGQKEGKITLAGLLNDALDKYLEKVKLR